jgi:predicted GIY-YIG superfamily endonuclease
MRKAEFLIKAISIKKITREWKLKYIKGREDSEKRVKNDETENKIKRE